MIVFCVQCQLTNKFHRYHSFADPADSLSTPTNVDQTYFNVGWGGVRSSSLPIALEPDFDSNTLAFTDPDAVDYLELCPWGPNSLQTDLKYTRGYTTFVEEGLSVNRVVPTEDTFLPCTKPTPTCTADAAACMVTSCTQTQIDNGYTRMELNVQPGDTPNCQHRAAWNGLMSLRCEFRNIGFGNSSPEFTALDPCAPWTKFSFRNTLTGEKLDVAYIRHWSWKPDDRYTYFSLTIQDDGDASARTEVVAMVNAMFDNSGNANVLPIEVVPTTPTVTTVPASYDPASLNAFTFVHGDGAEYGIGLEGRSRRRLGSTMQVAGTRDYTVFTVNWYVDSIQYFCFDFLNSSYVLLLSFFAPNFVIMMIWNNIIILQAWHRRKTAGREYVCQERLHVCK